jgi:hypothetical protein
VVVAVAVELVLVAVVVVVFVVVMEVVVTVLDVPVTVVVDVADVTVVVDVVAVVVVVVVAVMVDVIVVVVVDAQLLHKAGQKSFTTTPNKSSLQYTSLSGSNLSHASGSAYVPKHLPAASISGDANRTAAAMSNIPPFVPSVYPLHESMVV